MAATNKRLLQPGERIRVLVVDDSVVIRRLVTHALEQDPALEVVGAAAHGAIALQRIPQCNPDVLTLDIEMPEMDGLETLRRVRREYPRLRVIMFSTLTERGAAVTLEALSSAPMTTLRRLPTKARSTARWRACATSWSRRSSSFSACRGTAPGGRRRRPRQRCRRPRGVREFRHGCWRLAYRPAGLRRWGRCCPNCRADFPCRCWWSSTCLPCLRGCWPSDYTPPARWRWKRRRQGAPVVPGRILIAPGDFHMRVAAANGKVQVCLDQSPPENSCRPAVDALFASLGEVYGGAVLAVILTGMGQDGLRGVQILKARGARVLAQDEASSVVWGMPGAVVNAGLADRVLPLEQVAPEILRLAGCR
jgi:two-component system chemotaxis response regulator CheB